MKVLRAPDKFTRSRVTSKGTVEFADGVAVEFTPEQAAHFMKMDIGYSIDEINDLPLDQTGSKSSKQKDDDAGKDKVDTDEEARMAEIEEIAQKAAQDKKEKDKAKAEAQAKKDAEDLKIAVVPTEETPFPELSKFCTRWGIKPKGRKAADKLVAILADPRFAKPAEKPGE